VSRCSDCCSFRLIGATPELRGDRRVRLPAKLADAVDRAVALEVERRFPTARAMKTALPAAE
jgi:hypothetical protein